MGERSGSFNLDSKIIVVPRYCIENKKLKNNRFDSRKPTRSAANDAIESLFIKSGTL
jgi:hypothetical protein